MNVTDRLLQIVEQARQEGESAKRAFEREQRSIERDTRYSIGLYEYDAMSRASDLVNRGRVACDELYSTLQGLVSYVDREAKALLPSGPARDAVEKVADLIEWFNEESDIENNTTISVNGKSLGQGSRRYAPSVESRMIEKDWRRVCYSMSGDTEEDLRYAAQMKAKRQREENERQLERDRERESEAAERQRQEYLKKQKEKEEAEEKERKESERQQEIAERYVEAITGMSSSISAEDFDKSAAEFDALSAQFSDCAAKAELCRKEAERIRAQAREKEELRKKHGRTKTGIWAVLVAMAFLICLLLEKYGL